MRIESFKPYAQNVDQPTGRVRLAVILLLASSILAYNTPYPAHAGTLGINTLSIIYSKGELLKTSATSTAFSVASLDLLILFPSSWLAYGISAVLKVYSQILALFIYSASGGFAFLSNVKEMKKAFKQPIHPLIGGDVHVTG